MKADASEILSELLEEIETIVAHGGKAGMPVEAVHADLLAKICGGKEFDAMIEVLVKSGRIKRKGAHLVATPTGSR